MSRCWADAPVVPRPFEAVAAPGGPSVRITLRGELDSSVRKDLDELVSRVARTESSFVLDCSALSFIDAGGISSLVRAHALGASVVGTSGAVRRTLALVGLVEVLGQPADVARI